jgi:DNA repair exonuclease SbcCD ATPase subunit
MILVITHIDELRDSFDVHLQVQKTPNGSQVLIR